MVHKGSLTFDAAPEKTNPVVVITGWVTVQVVVRPFCNSSPTVAMRRCTISIAVRLLWHDGTMARRNRYRYGNRDRNVPRLWSCRTAATTETELLPANSAKRRWNIAFLCRISRNLSIEKMKDVQII